MFVEACRPGMTALEIGAAYGVATLPAIARGAHVIANDLDETHLAALAERCPHRERLTLLPGRFPRNLSLAGESVDLILASNVLHFLTAPQLRKGVESFQHWLRPGGQVYAVTATPYLAPFAEFVPEFERRKANGAAAPGWIENARAFSRHGLLSQIPRSLHLLDETIMRELFADWAIERCWMFRRRDLSRTMWLDGRESVGLVARKRSHGV